MVLEYVGHLAGLIVAISLAPQVMKAWKTKSTRDISLLWTMILLVGLALWIIYGFANLIYPLMIFASIEFVMIFSLFVLKLRYK